MCGKKPHSTEQSRPCVPPEAESAPRSAVEDTFGQINNSTQKYNRQIRETTRVPPDSAVEDTFGQINNSTQKYNRQIRETTRVPADSAVAEGIEILFVYLVGRAQSIPLILKTLTLIDQ